MKWLREIFYKLKILYRRIMASYAIPVTENKKFINKNEVSSAYILITPGGKFIHCVINDQVFYLFWTPELEEWVKDSGFILKTIHQSITPDPKFCFTVSNIPGGNDDKPTKKLKFG